MVRGLGLGAYEALSFCMSGGLDACAFAGLKSGRTSQARCVLGAQVDAEGALSDVGRGAEVLVFEAPKCWLPKTQRSEARWV